MAALLEVWSVRGAFTRMQVWVLGGLAGDNHKETQQGSMPPIDRSVAIEKGAESKHNDQ
jgi:hypothetical protein